MLAHWSPRKVARAAGVLYLFNFITGVIAMQLISRGAQRQGDAVNLVAAVLYTGVTVLLCDLFWPVSPVVSVIAAVASLLGCWLPTVTSHLGLTLPFSNFVFFGIYCGLIGLLILRSRFMPRLVGVLMVIAGVCWLTTAYPPLAHRIWPVVMGGGLLGEGALIVWLLVRGVNEREWKEQARWGTDRPLA